VFGLGHDARPHRRSEYPTFLNEYKERGFGPQTMPIIFPSNTKGVTTGMLRQIKQQGYTTANGGFFDQTELTGLAVNVSLYLEPIEPLGKYMSALEKAREDAEEMTAALLKNTNAMVEQAKETHKQLNDINGKMRDGAEKLGGALEKFNKIAGNTNFAETAKQAESLVSSLERLAALEASGMLDKVMKAMTK